MFILKSIGAKIFGAVLTILIFPVAAATLSIHALSEVHDDTLQITIYDIPLTKALTNVSFEQLEQQHEIERVLLTVVEGEAIDESDRRAVIADAVASFEIHSQAANEAMRLALVIIDEMVANVNAGKRRDKFSELSHSIKKIADQHREFDALAYSIFDGLRDVTKTIDHNQSEKFLTVEIELDRQIKSVLLEVESSTKSMITAIEGKENEAITRASTLMAVALIVGGLIIFVIRQNIATPLKGVAYALDQMSDNNLDVKLPDPLGRKDEIAVVIGSINNYQRALQVAAEIETRSQEEREKSEQLIRQSESLFRTTINTVVDGVILVDDDGRIQLYNPACERLFGYMSNEVIGQDAKMLLPESQQDEFTNILSRKTSVSETSELEKVQEVFGRHKDGTTFPMEISTGKTMISSGRAFVGVIRDISHQVAVRNISEQHLNEQNTALQNSLTRQKTIAEGQRDFIAVANHELRTPLSVVDGYSRMIARDVRRQRYDRIEDRSNQIRAAVQQMQDVVTGTLDSARLEAGQYKIERSVLNVPEFVREEIVRRQIIWSSYTFDFDDPAESIEIVTDPQIIGIALSNLLSNAIKYSNEGSTIRIGITDGPSTVQITVKDEGTGIDAHDQSSLFTPFFRAERTNLKPGTGLGLSLARQLLILIGGDITFESEIGVGSVFTIHSSKTISDVRDAAEILT